MEYEAKIRLCEQWFVVFQPVQKGRHPIHERSTTSTQPWRTATVDMNYYMRTKVCVCLYICCTSVQVCKYIYLYSFIYICQYVHVYTYTFL